MESRGTYIGQHRTYVRIHPYCSKEADDFQPSATSFGPTTRGAPVTEEWPGRSCRTSSLILNVPPNRRSLLGVIL